MTAKAVRLPRPGETLIGTQFTLVSGGKGGNQAAMAAHMGAPTFMVGCVGDDPFRDIVLESLRAHGVNTSHIAVLPGVQTGIAHIRVDEAGQNDIVIVPHANQHLNEAQIDRFFAARLPVRVALLQLEVPLSAVLHAARRAKEGGLTVVLDPAPATPLPDELYRLVDILTPNETEAEALTGVPVTNLETAAQAARVLRERGVPKVVLTLGSQGVYAESEEGALHLPTVPVPVVDTTAAGDAFTGALGACLAAGMTWTEALPTAIAAGACTVTRMGAQSSLPSRDEVRKLLERGT